MASELGTRLAGRETFVQANVTGLAAIPRSRFDREHCANPLMAILHHKAHLVGLLSGR